MSGLEEIGIPGSEYLREALTNCSDPITAIEEFQEHNGILLPSLRPALPFLDLHGVDRLEFHQSVVEELRERLIQQIANQSSSSSKEKHHKLKDLLDKSFCLVKNKLLQPVVMTILKHMTRIPDNYLQQILKDKELYKECSTEVKRQIWQENQSLFGDEVSPLLTQYINTKQNLLFTPVTDSGTFFTPSPKTRRQSEVVQTLTDMIGRNVLLYDMVLQFLRTLFLRTRNVHYCTLRVEVLMSLHDLEVHEICNVDPCHKFTWCLDACIRERFVDTKRSRELQGFLDGIKRGQEQVLGDLAMILCDPYAVYTVAMTALKALQHCINTEVLSRESQELLLMLRMLTLGATAWHMLDSQTFKEKKIDVQLMIKFVPSLMTMMVDDQIHVVQSKLPDERPSSVKSAPYFYLSYVGESPLAGILSIYYTLQVCRQKDRLAVMRALPVLPHCDNERSFEDTTLHLLVSALVTMAEDFAHEDFCSVVFDEFFLPSMSRESVVRHLLRLLWVVHPHLTAERRAQVMKAVTPTSQFSEVVHKLYNALSEKIESQEWRQEEPVESLESPLISVPTPAR